jgi:predicted MFS family arabinose efflux permease
MICAILALVLLGEGRDVGTGLLALTAAVGLLVAFIAIERRAQAPLVRLGVLRQGLLAAASAAGALFMAAFFGFQLLVTLQLQDLRGWSPLATGLTFAVIGIDLVLAPILTPPLVRRFGNAAIMVAGFACAAAGYALFLRVGPDWGYLDMLASLALIGVAFTLAYGPLTLAATDGVDEAEHGLAGGVLYTAFQFGAALGLAIIAVVLGRPDGGVGLAEYRTGHIVPTVLALAAVAIVGAAILGRRRGRPGSAVHSGG